MRRGVPRSPREPATRGIDACIPDIASLIRLRLLSHCLVFVVALGRKSGRYYVVMKRLMLLSST